MNTTLEAIRYVNELYMPNGAIPRAVYFFIIACSFGLLVILLYETVTTTYVTLVWLCKELKHAVTHRTYMRSRGTLVELFLVFLFNILTIPLQLLLFGVIGTWKNMTYHCYHYCVVWRRSRVTNRICNRYA